MIHSTTCIDDPTRTNNELFVVCPLTSENRLEFALSFLCRTGKIFVVIDSSGDCHRQLHKASVSSVSIMLVPLVSVLDSETISSINGGHGIIGLRELLTPCSTLAASHGLDIESLHLKVERVIAGFARLPRLTVTSHRLITSLHSTNQLQTLVCRVDRAVPMAIIGEGVGASRDGTARMPHSDTVSDNNLCAAECPIRHLEHPQAAIAGMWKLLLSMSDDALSALMHGMREPVFLLSSMRDL
jgi:hypothetical protein